MLNDVIMLVLDSSIYLRLAKFELVLLRSELKVEGVCNFKDVHAEYDISMLMSRPWRFCVTTLH